jgi:AraC-like DNA-binding protein
MSAPEAISMSMSGLAHARQPALRNVIEAASPSVAFACQVPPVRGGLTPRVLRRVREHVEMHLAEKISVAALAAIAGLSMFHFARAFKQSEGMTPHDYLVRRRVRRAMELLANSDLPVAEIALAVGFSDSSHCTRRFREEVGVCPRDYRWSTR